MSIQIIKKKKIKTSNDAYVYLKIFLQYRIAYMALWKLNLDITIDTTLNY